MKKIMFILILISSLWSEEIKIDDDYAVFVSKTRNVNFEGGVKSSNEVFFGKFSDYNKQKNEELKTLSQNVGNGATAGLGSAANGASNSVLNATGKAVGQNLGVGLGIGLVFGAAEAVYDTATAEEKYILVVDKENLKGEKVRISALLFAKNCRNENLIKTFLIQEINKKDKK